MNTNKQTAKKHKSATLYQNYSGYHRERGEENEERGLPSVGMEMDQDLGPLQRERDRKGINTQTSK